MLLASVSPNFGVLNDFYACSYTSLRRSAGSVAIRARWAISFRQSDDITSVRITYI
jgi:hypothetical protein